MADKKITDLAELASIVEANTYWFEIVDMSETLATNRNKRVSEETLKTYFSGITPVIGDWSPAVAAVTPSYSDGRYYKIGNIVTVTFDIGMPATVSTSNFTVTGLPYTPDNFDLGTNNAQYVGALHHLDLSGQTNPVSDDIAMILAIGSGALYVRKSGSTAADGYAQNVYLSEKQVIGTVTYISA